jgi:hypothetical protein
VLARYFTVNGIPLTWAGRFKGLYGYSIKRMNPRTIEKTWARMPDRMTTYERDERKPVIIVVTNKMYGDVGDSYVVMRLDTFLPMFATFYKENKERLDASVRE